MKAMILAAGRGKRMRPLTDHTPKALIEVRGKPLIVYHLENLAKAGIVDIVVNLAHLGDKIKNLLGDGRKYCVNLTYSYEIDAGLETGGGIYKALPLLGSDPFIVLSADIFTAFDFASLPQHIDSTAHLILVNNPDYHTEGDFALAENTVQNHGRQKVTYGNIGVFKAALFKDCQPGFFLLAPLIRAAADKGRVTGELFRGDWHNIGTPRDLSLILP